MTDDAVTNVVFAGLGGQGVLKASDILAEAAFRTGADAKKAEIHGMSQRGGSVTSDVRFGDKVRSPMVPSTEADFLVVLSEDQVDINRRRLRSGGTLITPDAVDAGALDEPRSLNVALLGVLSAALEIDPPHFEAAIRANLPERHHETNLKAFALGRSAGGAAQAGG